MIDNLAKHNIDRMLHEIAMLARGTVLAHEATQEEVLTYISESGNAEFERIFTQTKQEYMNELFDEVMEISEKLMERNER